MKKTIITIAIALLTATGAGAWGRIGHATVAYIAEQNLTPKAHKALDKYLNGTSIVDIASLLDEKRAEMLIDYGCEFIDAPRINTIPHTYEVDMQCNPSHQFSDNGRSVKNCVYFIDKYAADLKKARHMDDSTRYAEIAAIVHLIGDMHCPMHARYYPDDAGIGGFEVTLKGNKVVFHKLWDGGVVKPKKDWSYEQLGHLADRFSKREARKVKAGDVWDWAYDSARSSLPVREVKPGDVLSDDYVEDNQDIVESQLAKAGLRLSKQLNRIFR